MTPCPDIAIYQIYAGDAPTNRRFVGYFGPDHLQGVRFVGASAWALQAAMEDWWEEEQKKIGAREDRLRRAQEARTAMCVESPG